MKKIKISPLCLIWLIFFIQFQGEFFLPFLCAIFLHEAGHIIVARALKIKIKYFRLSILGARIETAHELSYRDEFFFAFGGPFVGFCGCAFAYPFAMHYANTPFVAQFLLPFVHISLLLTIFNLVPLSTLDGGRMLFCFVCRFFSLDFAQKILRLSSFFTLFTFWVFTVYLVIKISAGVPMLIFCSIFFAKCFVFNTKSGDFASF